MKGRATTDPKEHDMYNSIVNSICQLFFGLQQWWSHVQVVTLSGREAADLPARQKKKPSPSAMLAHGGTRSRHDWGLCCFSVFSSIQNGPKQIGHLTWSVLHQQLCPRSTTTSLLQLCKPRIAPLLVIWADGLTTLVPCFLPFVPHLPQDVVFETLWKTSHWAVVLFQLLSAYPKRSQQHAHESNHWRLSVLWHPCGIKQQPENVVTRFQHLRMDIRVQTQDIGDVLHMVQRQKKQILMHSVRKVPRLHASDLAIEVREVLIGVQVLIKGHHFAKWHESCWLCSFIEELHHLLEGHSNTKVVLKVLNTTTSPQSCETPNSTSSRAGCLNMFVMFVIMSVKGSWYHGPEHLCYQRVVDDNYHTSHIFNIYTLASSWHVG